MNEIEASRIALDWSGAAGPRSRAEDHTQTTAKLKAAVVQSPTAPTVDIPNALDSRRESMIKHFSEPSDDTSKRHIPISRRWPMKERSR